MRFVQIMFAALLFGLWFPAHAEGENPLAKLAWQIGPGQGVIGEKATIKIPNDYAFLGAADTKKFMELNQNFASGDQYLFAPKSLQWFAVFRFNPVGYVKDDETLDANEVLDAMKKSTEEGNEERRRRGWDTMTVLGWRFPPQYDRQTKLLEWAFQAKSDRDNSEVINYNTRLLGRTGVMEVVLVSDSVGLDTAVSTLKSTLTGYEYVSGEKYAEYKQGDHVAEFGLAALVAGGAAAVAAKKGFFAAIGAFLVAAWKAIAAAVIGAFAWLRSRMSKKTS